MKVGDLVKWTYYCGIVTHIYKPVIGLVRVLYPFGIGEHDNIDGAFKVYGREQDQPQFDYWDSIFTRNLSEAIRFSRC